MTGAPVTQEAHCAGHCVLSRQVDEPIPEVALLTQFTNFSVENKKLSLALNFWGLGKLKTGLLDCFWQWAVIFSAYQQLLGTGPAVLPMLCQSRGVIWVCVGCAGPAAFEGDCEDLMNLGMGWAMFPFAHKGCYLCPVP